MTMTGPGPNYTITLQRSWIVLYLGILGFGCFPLGIVAWVLGNRDLREMRAGRMDPSGIRLTTAGRILGIIFTCLWGSSLLSVLVVMVLAIIVKHWPR